MHINPGFQGKRREDPEKAKRIPPGQHLTHDFPVLSAGPTPKIRLTDWSCSVEGLVQNPQKWSWNSFQKLPQKTYKVDIHCVTAWSKLDTLWRGVSIATLLSLAQPSANASHVIAECYGGYTTNLPLEDVMGDKAFIGLKYDNFPLTPEHGGPARLVVPHLYFWKSAKWIKCLRLVDKDTPGFWEEIGYHMYGDPWQEQRYGEDESE
ncbi:MAG: sulfite oxidase-like oxidoreductase [Bacteroidota bacterium]